MSILGQLSISWVRDKSQLSLYVPPRHVSADSFSSGVFEMNSKNGRKNLNCIKLSFFGYALVTSSLFCKLHLISQRFHLQHLSSLYLSSRTATDMDGTLPH